MTIVTPLQPLAGGGMVQENFRQMVDHVLSYNPDCPPQLAKRRWLVLTLSTSLWRCVNESGTCPRRFRFTRT